MNVLKQVLLATASDMTCNFFEVRKSTSRALNYRIARARFLHAAAAHAICCWPLCAQQPDAVGALPIHAITVANTDEAVALSGELNEAMPDRLLGQVHVLHRAGFPLFTGESSLHICCVNKREDLLCKMIDLVRTKLTSKQATELFQSQAAGVFFNTMPMLFYGGTPLACALAPSHLMTQL